MVASTRTPPPTREEIAGWLLGDLRQPEIRAEAWALFLVGLPWKYIRPLVQIAVDSHQPHPKAVLEQAKRASSDRAFKAAATRHLKKWAAAQSP